MALRLTTCAAVMALSGLLIGGRAEAQATATPDTCGQNLSAPVYEKWLGMGGAQGLGCPTAIELPSPTSPTGATGREVTYPTGAILWHATGPRAGQTYAVDGCIYRLYVQYGGPGGWLGLPTSDPINTPDGQRQTFEGGVMTYRRLDRSCDAERVEEPAPVAVSSRAPLVQCYETALGDYVAAASSSTLARLQADKYEVLRTEGYVFTDPSPGLVPLKVYLNEALNAHDDIVTAEAEHEAQAAGYQFDGVQGFVYADPHPDTRPLKHFRDASGTHSLLTATPEGEADALAHGYRFVRIEGYVSTAP